MITKNEMEIANTSYTHKDFYQIYPELLELTSKLTDKWDPSASNESDPGVVLLKLLAFIGDKNNYNIDKSILEAFMPSCTQEESMRKLCDLMGYPIRYYRSATTTISIMCTSDKLPKAAEKANNSDAYKNTFISLPITTVFSNEDGTITYIVNPSKGNVPIKFETRNQIVSVEVIQCNNGLGRVLDTDTYVQLDNLDNNKLYLPETQIAENGIFVRELVSIDNQPSNRYWQKVDNLNDVSLNEPVFKFGFDSKRKLPYIEFPDYIANIIDGGLDVQYVRTSGAAGNISARVASATTADYHDDSSEEASVNIEDNNGNSIFTISNVSSATNGSDKETIDEAYNGFKKTIGTFSTLVTDRDYANAIYKMTTSDTDLTPLVSNIQASDIRNDLNYSNRYVTYNENGIVYKTISTKTANVDDISHFDLYLYPFSAITGSYNKISYNQSFKPGYLNNAMIEENLADYKTISHVIKYPDTTSENQMFCIKVYYDLNARIITNHKVNTTEENDILKNVYNALYTHFNARNVDFGEEISYDKVLQVVQDADNRIKSISLDDFDLKPFIMLANGNEYPLTYTSGNSGNDAYVDIIAKNVLANRMSLFDYNTSINTYYGQEKSTYNLVYGNDGTINTDGKKLISMTSSFDIDVTKAYTLQENEVIQLKAPNYGTDKKYVYGVLYNWSGSPINADTDYLLSGQDRLVISYENESGDAIIAVYAANKLTTYKNGVPTPSLDNDNQQIIKPSGFALKNKQVKTKSITIDEESIDLFRLDTNESIETRKPIQSTLKNMTLKCSWVLKGGQKNLFGANSQERLLEEGEYFFYTNETETELVVLGSGTDLKASSTALASKFKLDDSNINIDDIANNGIGAFSSSNWSYVTITGNDNLVITENQFITLSKGDSINLNSKVTSDAIKNTFKELTDTSGITYGQGTTNPSISLPTLPGSAKWGVRSLLLINIGPNQTQLLSDSQHVVLNLKDLTTQPDIKGTTIYSNIYIQNARGNINLETVKDIDNTYVQTNDALIFVSDNKAPALPENVIYTPGEDLTIPLSKLSTTSVEFGVVIIAGTVGLIAIYNNGNNDDIVVTSTADGDINIYGEAVPTPEEGEKVELKLKNGLNIIQVNKSTSIGFTATTSKQGNIIIKPMNVVNATNSVANYNLTGFGVSASEASNFTTALSNKLKAIPDFYYNAPAYDNIAIDTTFNDTLVWFDYNNIVNRFVLAELNADSFKNIKVAKASKL